MDNKECAIKIFKNTFDLYKSNNEKLKKKETKLYETVMKDDLVFNNIKHAFKILAGIIKFYIIKENDYYKSFLKELGNENTDSLDEIINLEVIFPKNKDELLCFFIKYPKLIYYINEDMYKIISLEHYEGLLLINNINPMLYYSVIDQDGFSQKIEFFEQDYDEFYDILKDLIKKTLAIYIDLVKNSDVSLDSNQEITHLNAQE